MVMPIYDDNPFRLPHRPIVTWLLIVANIGMFLLEWAVGPGTAAEALGLTPAALSGLMQDPDALTPSLTLITYMFLHADIGHLVGNMVFLWVFADDIEEALGRLRFLLFYLACGMLAGLGYVASGPTSQSPLIGASGAISAIVIAYVMLRPCAKITVLLFGILPLRISAYWVVGTFVLVQFISLEVVCQKRRRILVPPGRHDRGRGPVPVDAATRSGAVRMYPGPQAAEGRRHALEDMLYAGAAR